MSKRPFDTNQNKMSRNDRFVQMSQQEMLIEQKKREIQAKLEAKRRQVNQDVKDKTIKPTEVPVVEPKECPKSLVNQFSNDGSFLNQFKQLNDKKKDSRFKTFNKYRDKEREREKVKEKEKEHTFEVATQNNSEPNNDRTDVPRQTRFSTEPIMSIDPQKIAVNASFTTNPPPMTNNFHQAPPMLPNQQEISLLGQLPSTTQVPPQIPDFSVPPQLAFPNAGNANFTTQTLLSSVGVHLNTSVAPPTTQIISSTVTQQLNQPTSMPPLIQQTVGLVGQPVQDLLAAGHIGPANISTSEQTQTVMTQTAHLFGTTTTTEQLISGPPPVLLNVPPPQIVPQTQLVITPQNQNVLVSAPSSILTTVTIPPPVMAPQNLNISAQNILNVRPPGLPAIELTSIPPPNPIQLQNIPQPEPLNTLNIPPPAPLQVSSIPTPSSLQLNEIPNPKPIDLMAIPTPNEHEDNFTDSSFLKNIPPPNKNLPPPNVSDLSFLANIQQVSGPPSLTSSLPPNSQTPVNRIPSLMSQRVLPPPGMGVNIPPPMLHTRDITQPPPNFNLQIPPPIPNINVPPPMIGPPAGMPHRNAFKEEILVGTASDVFLSFSLGGAEFEAMANLARMVAECGPSVEDVVRQKKNRDPELWFLFHKESPAYRQYAGLVEQYKREREDKERTLVKPDPSEIYEPEMALEDDDFEDSKDNFDFKQEIKQEENMSVSERNRRERKRKSRWGEKDNDAKPPISLPVLLPQMNPSIIPPVPGGSGMLSKVTRTDPGLLQYTMQTYGSNNLSDEDWKKAEDNYKIHLLYQDMVKKREELEKLQRQGKNKYEYDSDEETEGGTWEHKLREKEMVATEKWAVELNRQAEGKHHIGDFLPPEELKRFMEKSSAVKEGRQLNFSDYKEFKIKEDNIGFKMLQKLGWTEGQGLGQNNAGIVDPVNKGAPRDNTQGLGLNVGEATEDEDEYDSYRKRMMLAYRFRPNPLNNPRRPYY
ncbi:hypothetical protein D910_11368 [Dendroctonus ponderosae]|uniref:G-patch domain-containing protein n=1 Tax=Dendroctonus ponderosae TaxID=77166 RepID=U4UV28_DENPD|nr:hypothetical protein D910_11368 [Dendroctonus ponderosae]